ncbi:MAG TPA: PIN domain-containing protein [Steroidobacteraceae bacterium]
MVSRTIAQRHQRVLIDTSVWIYHFEEHAAFGEAAGRVIEELEAGRFRGIASELTLLEIIVKPLQLGRQDAADDYETLLSYFPNLDLIPISRAILLDAAGLRARHRLRTPDAIQLATAFSSGATLTISNDEAWSHIAGIETLLLSQLAD